MREREDETKKKNDKNEAIRYSEVYYDMEYEYRHVVVPLEMVKMIQSLCDGEHRLLKQNEWSQFLIQDDSWEHYSIHRPEPHVLLFRRPLSSREPPSETSLFVDAGADVEHKVQQSAVAVDEDRRQARSRTGDTIAARGSDTDDDEFDDDDDGGDNENQRERNGVDENQDDNDGRVDGDDNVDSRLGDEDRGARKSNSKVTRGHVINSRVSSPPKQMQIQDTKRAEQQQLIKEKRTRFHDDVAMRSPPRVGRSIRFDFQGGRITHAPMKRGRQQVTLYTLVSPKRLNFEAATVVGGSSSGGGSGSFGSTGDLARAQEQRLRANIIISSTSASSRGTATPMPTAYSSAQLCLLSFESSLAKSNATTPTRP